MTDRGSVGVVPLSVLMTYDGLAFLKALMAGELPPPPITETLGFALVEAEHGRAAFEGEPQFRHYNPIGTVHAGFAATLLDSAVACAVHSTMAKGETYTTLELKLNLVRALTSKVGVVRAEGRIIHRGRSIATAQGELRDREGTLYAHATTTCMIFPARAAAG
jgi:uncharacterized protein (TIGR00369 family)